MIYERISAPILHQSKIQLFLARRLFLMFARCSMIIRAMMSRTSLITPVFRGYRSSCSFSLPPAVRGSTSGEVLLTCQIWPSDSQIACRHAQYLSLSIYRVVFIRPTVLEMPQAELFHCHHGVWLYPHTRYHMLETDWIVEVHISEAGKYEKNYVTL